jgi:peptide deformylase
MILKIWQDDDPMAQEFLRKTALPWTKFDEDLLILANDMLETVAYHRGLGLAAPQVGRPWRVIVAQGVVMVNPHIVSSKLVGAPKSPSFEGCLSVNGGDRRGYVDRYTKIEVEYQDLDGKFRKTKARHLSAAVIQHEIDHLNGVIFTDYLKP